MEYFQTNEKYCFIAGKKPLEKISNKLIKNNITVVKGNSWDYSKVFVRTNKKKFKKKYAVYLDAPGPRFLSDSALLNQKHTETINHTYPSLRNFFNFLEKNTKSSVVITTPKN